MFCSNDDVSVLDQTVCAHTRVYAPRIFPLHQRTTRQVLGEPASKKKKKKCEEHSGEICSEFHFIASVSSDEIL